MWISLVFSFQLFLFPFSVFRFPFSVFRLSSRRVFVAAAGLGEPVAAHGFELGRAGVFHAAPADEEAHAGQSKRAEDEDRDSEHTPPPEGS